MEQMRMNVDGMWNENGQKIGMDMMMDGIDNWIGCKQGMVLEWKGSKKGQIFGLEQILEWNEDQI